MEPTRTDAGISRACSIASPRRQTPFVTSGLARCFLAVLLLAFPAMAQDRLEPVTPPDDVISRGHAANLRAVFREAYEPRVEARAFVYPAFAPEYAVGLRRGADGYEIFLIEPSLQISRYASVVRRLGGHEIVAPERRAQQLRDAEADRRRLPAGVSDVPVSSCSAAVDEETAATLIRAWRRMLQQVEPNRDGMVMFDGVHYTFSMLIGGRLVEGTTWRGMPPELAEAMAAYCSRSSRARWIALSAGLLLAPIALVAALLLLIAGLARLAGRPVPGTARLGSLFRRRSARIAWATVSIVLVALLGYAAIAGGNSREMLGIAQVIAAAR